MKQSVGLVILQIFSIVIGFVSVFWVAGSLPSEEYSIVGIYHIIASIIIISLTVNPFCLDDLYIFIELIIA